MTRSKCGGKTALNCGGRITYQNEHLGTLLMHIPVLTLYKCHMDIQWKAGIHMCTDLTSVSLISTLSMYFSHLMLIVNNRGRRKLAAVMMMEGR